MYVHRVRTRVLESDNIAILYRYGIPTRVHVYSSTVGSMLFNIAIHVCINIAILEYTCTTHVQYPGTRVIHVHINTMQVYSVLECTYTCTTDTPVSIHAIQYCNYLRVWPYRYCNIAIWPSTCARRQSRVHVYVHVYGLPACIVNTRCTRVRTRVVL